MGMFGRSALAEQTPTIIEYDSFYKTAAFTVAATNIAANSVLVTNASKRVLTSSPSTGYLYWNGSAFVWQSPTGSGLPGGNQYDIQYNDGVGGFAGQPGYTSPCNQSGIVYDLVTQYGVVQSFSEVGEGSSGYLYHDGYGGYSWSTPCTSGGSPGGSDGDIQYNNYGSFGGISGSSFSPCSNGIAYNVATDRGVVTGISCITAGAGLLYNDGYNNFSWVSPYTGDLNDSNSNKIADVVDGLITTTYY
jgi:hypothetical protein